MGFVEGGFQDDADLRIALRKLACEVVDDRVHAATFIVSDPTQCGQRNLWCAILIANVTSTTAVVKGKGPLIKYDAAIRHKRKVFVTGVFTTRHPRA
eukprot:NODE_12060_length_1248_cov_4.595004.p5 GENE.NODE_12060_length_1248_cov_4.595004~~NODE_12060_length_1248_cov_4.595004.p5  ORF type:complete len:97 (+),score=20.90 NODE_12060_length_1248_cov_4.595004:715-1005(+)